MTDAREVWLVRHGSTEWSASGKHTSYTDMPLTEAGEEAARALGERLASTGFDLVLTSPLVRARRTVELAGWPDAEVVEDLREWNYGDYEGITTNKIRETVPDWTVWTHETPGGENAEQVGERLGKLIRQIRGEDGRVLIVGHGHCLRALAACWLGQSASDGRFYRLETATVSVLGYEHDVPVIVRWNC